MEAQLAKQSRKKTLTADADATERLRVEEALKASEARYRRLFETAKDGILILNGETGRIIDSNSYLEKMLGYSHTELQGKRLWEIGSFKDIAASQASFRELLLKKYIRYEDLPLETKGGERRQVEFVSNVYRVDQTKVIQCNVRDITSRKLAEASLQRANDKLSSVVATLRHRDGEMSLLNHMNELLQTCETPEEAYRVIPMIATELFAGQSGCLAVFQGSCQFLETVARWGDGTLVENVFPMKDCWAIRRGRPHEVVDPKTSLLCEHFVRPPERGYLCLPLTVQGETLGIFYLDAAPPSNDDRLFNQRQLAVTVGETIKLSLANLKLQKTLHEQATRDPLTGLFNRRYLDETLPRELHGALRRDAPLCVAMIDLDHFKRFNDTFGHDTGDLVLRESGCLLRDNLRKSDVACRYGGEEFVLVLPDSSLADTSQRLEQLRILFEKLEIRQNGQLMATTTISAGVAAAPEHGSTMEGLLRAADDALYAAKDAGRNRVAAYQLQN
jgi:diguanylate cyclase (GGDEF)-like protein/PAS domain S-box-containing protein